MLRNIFLFSFVLVLFLSYSQSSSTHSRASQSSSTHSRASQSSSMHESASQSSSMHESANQNASARMNENWNASTHVAMSVCESRSCEALASLKSALFLLNPNASYVFHLFTDESWDVKRTFIARMRRYAALSGLQNVSFKYYKIDAKHELQSLFRPCSANRLLMPEALAARNVTRFVYVDTDVLWLEDPATVDRQFDRFRGAQELGFAYEVENDEKDPSSFHYDYHLPISGPNGLNAGVGLFRVLDPRKMTREFLEIAKEYAKQLKLGDQDIINIFGHRHPESMYKLPCHYNRRPGSKCETYTSGLVHGNNFAFHFKRTKKPRPNVEEYPLRYHLIHHVPMKNFQVCKLPKMKPVRRFFPHW